MFNMANGKGSSSDIILVIPQVDYDYDSDSDSDSISTGEVESLSISVTKIPCLDLTSSSVISHGSVSTLSYSNQRNVNILKYKLPLVLHQGMYACVSLLPLCHPACSIHYAMVCCVFAQHK